MSEQNNNIFIQFENPETLPSIIKIFGVGGGGSNAVNHMFIQGIIGVEFVICNTDLQSLGISPVPDRLQIGKELTEGRGAGSSPEIGRNAALENADQIREILSNNTKMVFITAGMGGGTGTGAAPIIAQIAKELDILTIGIVTTPFGFEGPRRRNQANQGIEEMKKYVDSLIVINNDKIREHYGNLKFSEAFAKANDILKIAAKGISELITETGYINVDFEDVKTVMRNSGTAIMGVGVAEGENRTLEAVEQAINSPLLNNNEIYGARNILLYISSGDDEVSLDEAMEISEFIQNSAGADAEIIWGKGYDANLGNKISVTVIATNFDKNGSINSNNKNDTTFFTLQTEKPIDTEEDKLEMKVVVKPFSNESNNNTTNNENAINQINSINNKEITPQKTTIELEIDNKAEEPFANTYSSKQQNTANFDIFRAKTFEPIQKQDENILENNNNIPLSESKIEIREIEHEETNPFKQELQNDRMQSLKGFNFTNSRSQNFEDYERGPAFARRGINLAPENPSDEKIVSRFTLSDNGDKKPEIRENNPFLHDNVD